MTRKICANDWCTRPLHAKGYCGPCYRRGWAAGDMNRARIRYENWGQSRSAVDEEAVNRLVAGDIPEDTTLGEREEAVRRLHARGWNDVEIETRLHRPSKYATKVRRRLGLPPNQNGGRRTGQVYVTARDHDRTGGTSSTRLLAHPWIAESMARRQPTP